MTVDEYLGIEEAALDRHEYRDGEVFEMPPSSPTHSLIATNVICELGLALRSAPYYVLGCNMRLRTSPTGLYAYADAVVCGKPVSVDRDTLLNPLVIVEVLSASTGDYIRGTKFERYRQIPSFREYLIVAQDRVYIEHHVRSDPSGQPTWTMREFTSPEDVIIFESVGVQLPCSAIYAEVGFAEHDDLQEAT